MFHSNFGQQILKPYKCKKIENKNYELKRHSNPYDRRRQCLR